MNNINAGKNELSKEQRKELLDILKARFEKNMGRHDGLDWTEVQTRLQKHPEKIWSLNEMERTGGEPDVIIPDTDKNEYFF